MKPRDSKPGIMYGLCKVRKFYLITRDVPPFQPIVSAIGTSADSLGKFFAPFLKEHTIKEYTVRDSFSFCNEIQKQNSSLYMAFFDIQSLFTKIPLD